MSDVLEILKRGDSGLEALLRAVLLDSDNKVPADRLRIVGALDDGAVIEQGSNINGDWVRFANGTQICICNLSVAIVSTAGPLAGGIYEASIDFLFPASFIAIPAASAISKFVPNIYTWANLATVTTSASTLYAFYTSKPNTDLVQSFSVIVIGKWK